MRTIQEILVAEKPRRIRAVLLQKEILARKCSVQLFTNCEWYFIPRLREHVQDATKNPMLIFPEGEQIPLLVHICHPLKFIPSPSWFS